MLRLGRLYAINSNQAGNFDRPLAMKIANMLVSVRCGDVLRNVSVINQIVRLAVSHKVSPLPRSDSSRCSQMSRYPCELSLSCYNELKMTDTICIARSQDLCDFNCGLFQGQLCGRLRSLGTPLR